MHVCVIEDRLVSDLEPLTLTRPAFDLLCGRSSLFAKQCRAFAPCSVGVLVRPHLADLCRERQPSLPVNDLAWLHSAPAVLVNARWVPSPGRIPVEDTPHVALVDDEVAYAVVSRDQVGACTGATVDECLDTWRTTLPCRSAPGFVAHHLWDLVERNGEQIRLDFRDRRSGDEPGWRPASLAVIGPSDGLLLEATAQVDPMVVADTRGGPVIIDRDAIVGAFSRLEGPCYVGPHCHVRGARLHGGTSLGPRCRVGGEVEASIFQGHVNKYHEGFVGHSYVGEWVNFGAGSSTSDLRCDYGEVSAPVGGRRVRTGLRKVGAFVGDHTKTGLNTLLNTGSSIGAFCNLLPSGQLLPREVPSFCCWTPGSAAVSAAFGNVGLVEHADLDALLETAGEVMRRREATLTATHAALYRALCVATQGARQQILREYQARTLRRSA